MPIPIAVSRQRVLLAVLALTPREAVTVDRLIACLWDEQPPATARNTVQNYVLRLRHTLASAAERSPLVTSAAGYRLDVEPDMVDVRRFDTVLRAAHAGTAAGELESALSLVDEALGLWQGDPLADVPSEVLRHQMVPALVEQRLSAQEQRVDLALQLGRHRDLITELAALTTEHPLRERRWAHSTLFRSRA